MQNIQELLKEFDKNLKNKSAQYMSELETHAVKNNTVYVIYTNEGAYDTAHSEEAAHELAQMYGLCPGTYTVSEEQIYID